MAKNSMEITIHKISAAHNVARIDIVKADDAFHFFLSIDWLLNIVYVFRGLWDNNLDHLSALYFELIVLEGDHTYIYFNLFQHLSGGIVIILPAVCLVTSITTGSLSMRVQQSLFKRKWKFAPCEQLRQLTFCPPVNYTSKYIVNRLRSSHIIKRTCKVTTLLEEYSAMHLISSSSS